MKFSILIAVYNAEEFLPQCLSSLASQSFSDFEAICVDDASTDRSPQILRETAGRDSRFRVMRQAANRGQAVARNRGLQEATGTFTLMLDADDWLAPDALQCLADTLSRHPEADCAVMRLMFWYEEGRQSLWECRTEGRDMLEGREAAALWVRGRLHGLYAVRTDIHRRFPYDAARRLYSDDNTTLLHYYYSRRVVLSQATYFYRQHAASSTHVCTPRHFDRLQADLDLRKRVDKLVPEAAAHYENERWLRVVGCYFDYFRQRTRFSREERQQILRELRQAVRTVRPSQLDRSLRHKFGYCPLRPFWLFRVQEELYFFLRKCARHFPSSK